MISRRLRRLRNAAAVITALPVALSAVIVYADTETTTLSNGAQLAVSIDNPLDNQEFKVPAGTPTIDVPVVGKASVGEGEPDGTIIYVIDESGSTGSGSGTGCSPILQCEKNFFNNLNAAAIADGSIDLAGVVRYESSSVIAQALVPPTSGAITAAINGATPGGATNCAAGLDNARFLVTSGANTNGTSIVVFASDGFCNVGGTVAAAATLLGNTGAIVHSIAIGSGSDCTTNGGTGTLNEIPKNGGTCTAVADPGNLPNIIQDLIGSTLVSLEFEVDGGGQALIPNANISLPLPQPGSVNVTYTETASGLDPDTHTLCTTANGTDVLGDSQAITDCHDVQLLQLTASPAFESNELSVDDEHTVDGQILGGTGPDRAIDFLVTAGPHTGTFGAVIATPGGPAVSFTYNADGNECSSLGTDTIEVSTAIAGMVDSVELKKDWVDTIPPEAQCVETVNPHGKTVPPAGNTTLPGPKGGQNEDGFYELLAADNLSGASCAPLQIFVTDTGSGTVFGPFAVGDKIKYTEANGATPNSKKMGSTNGQAGAIAAHITGTGDAAVHAVDGQGNVSAQVSCLVPPPPK